MIAFICDNCGKEHRGHSLQDMICVPMPKGWWQRYSITSKHQSISLRACSEICCIVLDERWPASSVIWIGFDADGKRERPVAVRSPSLPEPPHDEHPFTAPMPDPGKDRFNL